MDKIRFIKIDIILFSILILFLVSLLLSILSGLDFFRAIIWNILTSLGISFDLPAKFFETPYLLIATAINMAVFAGLTVVLAALFFNYLKNIDIKKQYMLLKIKKMKDHIIVAPYNNDSKILLQEFDAAGLQYVVIGDRIEEMKRLYKQKRLFIIGKLDSEEVFDLAGIRKAKYLIVYSYKDFENIIIIITAKSINPNIKIICRINDNENIPQISRINISKIILPDIGTGEKIGQEIINKIYKIIGE